MNSFYTQQADTLFSVNHFTNQSLFTQGQNYQFGYFQPVYLGAPNQVWAPLQKLPTEWKPNQPKPSVHRMSQPPKAPIQSVPLAFTEKTESHTEKIISPPRFERHLSDPAFLLQPEPEQEEVASIAPPMFKKDLSDPAFLLETDPVEFQEMEVLDEWMYDEKEIELLSNPVEIEVKQVLDEWVYERPEPVVEARSKSTESGSSYASRRREPAVEQRTKRTEQREVAPAPVTWRPVQQKKTFAPKSVPDFESDTRVREVVRRRKKRKTIESGEIYRTKRYVKVTKEENPCFYPKPKRDQNTKRWERDPNEVWTVKQGVPLEVVEIRGKRAYVFCEVEFWSKHQDKTREQPRRKKVEGWITLKDQKGWVL